MRDLPIYDKSWIYNHISFSNRRIAYEYYMQFFNLKLVQPYSSITEDEFVSKNLTKRGIQLLIFEEAKTHELFKLNILVEDNLSIYKYFTEVLIENGICYASNLDDINYHRFYIDICTSNLNYIGNPIKINTSFCFDCFMKCNFDTNLLNSSSNQIMRDYINSHIRNNYAYIDTSNLNNILDLLVNQKGHINKYEFIDKIYDHYKFIISDLIEQDLKSTGKLNLVNLKYELLRKDSRFSGRYNVTLHKYTGNKKVRTFDTIDVEINMLDDYNRNLQYIKENVNNVKKLLKIIIETNNKSKKYANYLQLYNLTLTRENILVAKFCFKDGLEELCKKNNNLKGEK